MILDNNLIDTFKQSCPEPLAAILNCSRITLKQIYDGFKFPTDPDQAFNIGNIYSSLSRIS